MVVTLLPVSAAAAETVEYAWPTTTHTITDGRHYSSSHRGIDITASYEPVYASAAGRVEIVYNGCKNENGKNGKTCRELGLCPSSNLRSDDSTKLGYKYCNEGNGNGVIIKHNDGSYTLYAHLSEPLVTVGQSVMQGQKIGTSGSTGYSTGPHLHFAIFKASGLDFWPTYNAKAYDINPETVLVDKSTGSSDSSGSSTQPSSCTITTAKQRVLRMMLRLYPEMLLWAKAH